MWINFSNLFGTGLLSLLAVLAFAPNSSAQISPDTTLPNNSSVTVEGNNFIINGGTVRGGNLFHSFQDFSVPTGASALFNNNLGTANILGRVTGISASTIDGLLKANGNANLFLINPNGIVFGANASLNLGSSFVASTADRILLSDGSQFSASTPGNAPLLSIAVPTGLGFTSTNLGGITVLGTGHQLRYANPQSIVNSPIAGGGESSTGLKTLPDRTLALIGGPVNLEGGILTAPSGNIEIGGIAGGTVGITPTSMGFSFDYNSATKLQDIQLDARSLLDVTDNGQIDVFGQNLFLNGNSVVLVSNSGSQPPGAVNANVAESVNLKGVSDAATILSNISTGRIAYGGILSQNLGTSEGSSIFITASNLTLQDFGALQSANFGPARGGDVLVNLANSLSIVGTPPLPGIFAPSLIATFTTAGSPGNLELSGKNLSLQDGGLVLSQALGTANGGDITAKFSEQINIVGGFPVDLTSNSFVPSVLGSTTTFRGRGGNVYLNTGNLSVRDGGRINATTTAFGPAGDIRISARNAVEVLGRNPLASGNDPANSSQIISSTDIANLFLTDLFDTGGLPSGKTGNIYLAAPKLVVADTGLVNSVNEGVGPGGTIEANTDVTILKNGAITAESLLGPGGNIGINTDVLAGLENSVISAAASKDKGGSILIDARGVFFSPDSEITATSELGPQFNGIVEITTPELDLSKAASEPAPPPESPKVTTTCQSNSKFGSSEYIDAGRGGLPPKNPNSLQSSNIGWGEPENQPKSAAQVIEESSTSIVEAQGWKSNGDGTVSFVVAAPDVVAYSSLNTPSCHRDAKKGESIGVQNHKPEPSRGNRN